MTFTAYEPDKKSGVQDSYKLPELPGGYRWNITISGADRSDPEDSRCVHIQILRPKQKLPWWERLLNRIDPLPDYVTRIIEDRVWVTASQVSRGEARVKIQTAIQKAANLLDAHLAQQSNWHALANEFKA